MISLPTDHPAPAGEARTRTYVFSVGARDRRGDRSCRNTRRAMSPVENPPATTRHGGVTGAGFLPGQSGNPGGRPKGLARRVREVVGDNGELILGFMLEGPG